MPRLKCACVVVRWKRALFVRKNIQNREDNEGYVRNATPGSPKSPRSESPFASRRLSRYGRGPL